MTSFLSRRWAGLSWFLVGALVLVLAPLAAGRALPGTFNAPAAIADEPFLQEIGDSSPTDDPIVALAATSEGVFAGTRRGILRWQVDHLEADLTFTGAVKRLVAIKDTPWVIGEKGLFRRDRGAWVQVQAEGVIDLCEYRGTVVLAAKRRLHELRDGSPKLLSEIDCPFPILQVIPHADSLYVLGEGRLTVLADGRFGGSDVYGSRADQAWDWGALPSRRITQALSVDARLVLGTDRGLAVLRGMSLTTVDGRKGLPVEEVTCLAKGFSNDLWIGTSRGVIRQVGDQFHYFAGRRWLPQDRVHALAVSGDTAFVGTEGGLGRIRYEPFTLARKADYYERHLEEWGQKRLGLVHKLEWDDGLKAYVREAGDNDGGYSGDYLAAEAYRFAVTQDAGARREATNVFHALRWLRSITGIPGFPARAVWVDGEVGHKSTGGSGGYPAEWHAAQEKAFEWKGDTSSDELCSHFYAVTLFLELAAEGEEKAQARHHLAEIARHLVAHEWQLIDVDGHPTRWGRWDPAYFQTDEGHYDRGLQCLQLLSFMKTAGVLTGDSAFPQAYRRLVDLGYPQHTLRQRNTFPPEDVLHFLDQLAFWGYWNLLRYESDPALRSLYRRSLERTYEVVRAERQPWFNLIYGALTGNHLETDATVAHLREWPLDLRIWSYQNSHRADLRPAGDPVSLKGGIRAFPPRESEPLRWDHWTMQADGGTDGRDVVEPSGWLLAYWMARYHGVIAAPSVTDPRLLTVEHTLHHELGASPYRGPARPAIP